MTLSHHTSRFSFTRALSSASIRVGFVGLFGLVVLSAACGGDDDSAADPKTSCDAMCKKTGFTSSSLTDEGHELNCFCQGSGTVTDAACTELCTSLSKTGKPFRMGSPTNNACQCQ